MSQNLKFNKSLLAVVVSSALLTACGGDDTTVEPAEVSVETPEVVVETPDVFVETPAVSVEPVSVIVEAPDAIMATVAGNVVQSKSRANVAGLTVTLHAAGETHTTTTNTNGGYFFENVSPNSAYVVVVSDSQGNYANAYAQGAMSSSVVNLNLPAIAVSNTVTTTVTIDDLAGDNVTGLTLYIPGSSLNQLAAKSESYMGNIPDIIATENNGVYSFSVPDNNSSFDVVVADLGNNEIFATEMSGEKVKVANLTAGKNTTVDVIDRNSEASFSATLNFVDSQGNAYLDLPSNANFALTGGTTSQVSITDGMASFSISEAELRAGGLMVLGQEIYFSPADFDENDNISLNIVVDVAKGEEIKDAAAAELDDLVEELGEFDVQVLKSELVAGEQFKVVVKFSHPAEVIGDAKYDYKTVDLEGDTININALAMHSSIPYSQGYKFDHQLKGMDGYSSGTVEIPMGINTWWNSDYSGYKDGTTFTGGYYDQAGNVYSFDEIKGVDGVFNTEDDTWGPDNLQGTADDIPSMASYLGADGIIYTTASLSGKDAKLGTADDTAGPDGNPLTTEDNTALNLKYVNSEGVIKTMADFLGADGIGGTVDDYPHSSGKHYVWKVAYNSWSGVNLGDRFGGDGLPGGGDDWTSYGFPISGEPDVSTEFYQINDPDWKVMIDDPDYTENSLVFKGNINQVNDNAWEESKESYLSYFYKYDWANKNMTSASYWKPTFHKNMHTAKLSQDAEGNWNQVNYWGKVYEQLVDELGAPVYETDEEGNLDLNSYGIAVPMMDDGTDVPMTYVLENVNSYKMDIGHYSGYWKNTSVSATSATLFSTDDNVSYTWNDDRTVLTIIGSGDAIATNATYDFKIIAKSSVSGEFYTLEDELVGAFSASPSLADLMIENTNSIDDMAEWGRSVQLDLNSGLWAESAVNSEESKASISSSVSEYIAGYQKSVFPLPGSQINRGSGNGDNYSFLHFENDFLPNSYRKVDGGEEGVDTWTPMVRPDFMPAAMKKAGEQWIISPFKLDGTIRLVSYSYKTTVEAEETTTKANPNDYEKKLEPAEIEVRELSEVVKTLDVIAGGMFSVGDLNIDESIMQVPAEKAYVTGISHSTRNNYSRNPMIKDGTLTAIQSVYGDDVESIVFNTIPEAKGVQYMYKIPAFGDDFTDNSPTSPTYGYRDNLEKYSSFTLEFDVMINGKRVTETRTFPVH
ncbi:hypothetical protein RGQ13_07620 [Thalassotalea psychrophila]|uniref:Carboxypeptidase regulatory-like domain-containing protein n=1 Tax=Thalassotalea psychrophila TaxID=3065647 RepID=A0ABY9U3M8_9GAMM|nr:hypothetical protein RGQ13_07620 [Colwelliaceae bacterium SQ149]